MLSFRQYITESTLPDTKIEPAQMDKFKRHHAALSDDHHRAIHHYKGWSHEINPHLRAGKPEETHPQRNRLAALDHVTSHKIEHPMDVYRGFGHHVQPHKWKVGDVVHDAGYGGHSLTAHTSWKYAGNSDPKDLDSPRVIAKVHLPKGTKGHYLDVGSGHFNDEHEMLLHRNHKMQVTGHSKSHIDANGERFPVHVVHLQAVHHDD